MNRRSNLLRTLLLTGVIAVSGAGVACAEHHHYRVYDPYYTDYHNWDRNENGYYQRWADETHRDRDFRKLRPEEQKEYWTWRHNHGDHDRDDRDRDHH